MLSGLVGKVNSRYETEPVFIQILSPTEQMKLLGSSLFIAKFRNFNINTKCGLVYNLSCIFSCEFCQRNKLLNATMCLHHK